MTQLRRLAEDVAALVAGRPVPFTSGVVIREAVLVPSGGAVVRVRFEGGDHAAGTSDFAIDDSWGFTDAQDAVDQLYVDLVEQLDTGGEQGPR